MSCSRLLNAAIKANNVQKVRQLILAGAKADASSCILAIQGRQHEILRTLMKSGADPNALEPYWERPPIMKALKLNDFTAIQILLDAGASPDLPSRLGPPLVYAAREGNQKGVIELLKHGARVEQRDSSGNSALMWAAIGGHETIVQLLLKAGADPNSFDATGRTALDHAIASKQVAVVDLLSPITTAKGKAVKSATDRLMEAIRAGDCDGTEKILLEGVNVNEPDRFGWLPLHRAIDVGSRRLVRRLIVAGARVNEADRDGSVALDLALTQGRSHIVSILLKAGARAGLEDPVYAAASAGDAYLLRRLFRAGYRLPESKQGDCPALVIAAQTLSKACVKHLLDHGAFVDEADKQGWTALFSAAAAPGLSFTTARCSLDSSVLIPRHQLEPSKETQALQVLRLLVDRGADVNHRDKAGRTALTHTVSQRIARFLIRVGARLDIADRHKRGASFWMKRNGLMVPDLSSRAASHATQRVAPRETENGRHASKTRRF